MIDTIYLHMGAHKTGTTSIQEHLGMGRHLLEHEGWLYPSFDLAGTHEYNHSRALLHMITGEEGIPYNYMNIPHAMQMALRQRCRSQFQVQVDRFQGNKLILSGETIELFSAQQMGNLLEFLQEACPALRTLKVFYVLRHPVGHKASLYQQSVKVRMSFSQALEHEADTIDYRSGMLPGVQPEVRAVALQVVKSEYRALGRLFSPEKRRHLPGDQCRAGAGPLGGGFPVVARVALRLRSGSALLNLTGMRTP
jgi:hypothetical protein